MKTWFVCKAKFQKESDQGIIKSVTEAYLVDAFSYTEAESRIYEVLENMIQGEFMITQISKSNINELFFLKEMIPGSNVKLSIMLLTEILKKRKKSPITCWFRQKM